ncbi:hypothetical protein MAR_022420 [Mya arenaria]|uniref:Methyltransferase type 11 domain-containing protein n=1 Tax=Mya arenaria TaxID=6604 RepID=A0ABY7DK44_MYAAR|nr:uncharacterized protein LOC128226661 [Mya arenaria]WAQ98047.1 hypothetical protein MAR_022420 [Mya arenaria]
MDETKQRRMNFKTNTLVAVGVCGVLLAVKVFIDIPETNTVLVQEHVRPNTNGEPTQTLLAVIEQRNNVSKILNIKQQKIGQMECEKLGDKGSATSETGGWCQKASKEDGGQHMTDNKLVAALIELFTGKFVGSFGDGPGRYKQLVIESGKVKGYDAYDGAPYCDVTSEGRVQFLDLTLPQYGLPIYDWALSLEVAEHIPEQFESVFINNVVRHAREGVVLSWARPGQGGYSHINNKPFEYVKRLMNDLGFTLDKQASQKLQSAASFDWFKHNTNVFRRKQSFKDKVDGLNA